MKYFFLALLLSTVLPLRAQLVCDGYAAVRAEVSNGDTLTVVDMVPVMIFRRPVDTRRYARLIHNLKQVYPIAKEANRTLREIEAHIATLPSQKEKDAYVKAMEKKLKTQYTPVLRKLTFSQGKILIKLIDRETGSTSYQLVKELRGGFSAFLWQGVARLFGANLKDRYDKEGEDRMIERLIILYEAGLI